jgi:membrane-bound lytic murein transglycosylase D
MRLLKYCLFVLLAVFFTASDIDFGVEHLFNSLPATSKNDVEEVGWPNFQEVKKYLDDKEGRVSKTFAIKPYFEPTVYFWFLVYTEFASSQIIIHDKTNLRLIYKVLDFSALYEKSLPRFTVYSLQEKLSEEKIHSLKSDLDFLIHNPYSLEPRSKAIYQMIKLAGISIPISKKARTDFFRKLRANIRTQTGQRNFIQQGIVRAMPYQKFIADFLTAKKLPTEIFAIPFLESSFNPLAESRVSALGVWQFMPLIASFYVPKRTIHVDYRSNVGVASVAAANLLADNFHLLKSWDLAVTAYNSGTRHLLKSKRKLASQDVDLEKIIRISDSGHFGFASKNFYSEFLALTRVLAYKEDLFDDLHDHDRSDVSDSLRFFITKCSLRLNKALQARQLDDVTFHNNQIRDIAREYPRGLILTAKTELPKSKFYELTQSQLVKTKPKDWNSYLKNQSCSTR